jgi:uncharacterized protein (TIGR00645 family)
VIVNRSPKAIHAMRSLEKLIESLILASRWLLVIFYLGLASALAIYAFAFVLKLGSFAQKVMTLGETDLLLSMLALIDSALVASLIVMVIISGYENFVGRFEENGAQLSWLGKIDVGSLKIKVASTIIAISSIHLLQIFLNLPQYSNDQLMWFTIMHMAFVFSALFLGLIDKIMASTKKKTPGSEK